MGNFVPISVILLQFFTSTFGWGTLDGGAPILFGHQGDKALMPEHSLPSYSFGVSLGADFVEPDVVLTSDGVPICYHDITLLRGSNAGDFPEFQDRRRDFIGEVNGIEYNIRNELFVEDFSLEEIRRLRIRMPDTGVRPFEHFDQVFPIPTFDEFLSEMIQLEVAHGKPIGIIPEIKHPKFHNRQKEPYNMENIVLNSLQARGYNMLNTGIEADQRIIIQCFDGDSLKYIRNKTADGAQLMMLVHPELNWLTRDAVKEIGGFATHYSLFKEYLYTGVEAEIAFRNWTYDADLIDSMGGFIPPKEFPIQAHAVGLKMVVWTVNDGRENGGFGCAKPEGCDPEDKMAELSYFFSIGVDGVFVENMAESREIREKYEFEHRLGDYHI